MGIQPGIRARTDHEKFARRQAILDAADRHFREVGFEAFSMGNLAKLVGVAKGTLYLYFGTREEVFLSLYAVQIERWAGDLANRLSPGMSDEAFITAFFDASVADPAFLSLSIRLGHVIEQNVSVDALIESKRMMRSLLDTLTRDVGGALILDEAQSFELVQALGALLIGATRGHGGLPADDEDLPTDVAQFIAAFDSTSTFFNNARRILGGIRAGA